MELKKIVELDRQQTLALVRNPLNEACGSGCMRLGNRKLGARNRARRAEPRWHKRLFQEQLTSG